MQVDRAERGFSFLREGPLDMRMDPSNALTAEEIVNEWPEKELGDIFREYGEEPKWRLAAHEITSYRKKQRIRTTKQLADLLTATFKGKGGKKRLHPATLVFQALRICVNRELDAAAEGIAKAIEFLSRGGKLGVISFHSLEDRIVKTVLKEASKPLSKVKNKYKAPKVPAILKLLTKKPLIPTLAEMRANPRSRSAKLRFAQKN